jgi:hypothetical protein
LTGVWRRSDLSTNSLVAPARQPRYNSNLLGSTGNSATDSFVFSALALLGGRQALPNGEKLFDGCYIVSAEVPKDKMAAAGVVASCKKLGLIEEAFRNLKTVQLEGRPVYYKTDDRIKIHVFLCTIAYYLQWHLKKRL